MSYSTELGVLNPNIYKLTIGKKDLKEITILPLSFLDQETLFSKVSNSVMTALGGYDDLASIPAVMLLRDTISQNVREIIKYVVDYDNGVEVPVDDILKDITNEQLFALIDIVWEANYSDPFEKRGRQVFQKIQKAFPSATSSPPSPSDTASLSEQSSDITVTEGLPSDK